MIMPSCLDHLGQNQYKCRETLITIQFQPMLSRINLLWTITQIRNPIWSQHKVPLTHLNTPTIGTSQRTKKIFFFDKIKFILYNFNTTMILNEIKIWEKTENRKNKSNSPTKLKHLLHINSKMSLLWLVNPVSLPPFFLGRG